MKAQTHWERCEPSYVDANLERVVDTLGYDRLIGQLTAVLGTSMAGRPESAMRAWRALRARMDGRTYREIAAAEGCSQERIRQILHRIRRIVAAQPHLFDGFGSLDHAALCEELDCRFDSWSWRRGHTSHPPKTATLTEAAPTVGARKFNTYDRKRFYA